MKYSLVWILVVIVNAAAVLRADSVDDEALDILKRVRRVIGGEDVDAGQWPWLVHLKGKIPTKFFWGIPTAYKNYYCGGSVINKRWVLTAAHCFHIPGAPSRLRTAKYWHATIGEVDADHSVFDRLGGFFARLFGNRNDKIWYIHADQIHWHNLYNAADNWKHDVALIRLEKDLPIATDPDINAVTLASSSQGESWPQVGAECVMKGWGCVEAGGSVSDVARAVSLPVVGEATCSRYYGRVSATRVCAGETMGDKGICPGDSGGPLVCKVGDNWVQAGIASFTSSSNPGSFPGVFSRVSYYREWIDSVIN